MYPNLYYLIKDLLGIELNALKLVNSFGFFVAMAFVSSGYVLFLELKRKSALGEVQKRLNPRISLTTIVLTMFDGRTRLANDVADNVKKHFPTELVNIPIPRAVRVSEAPSYGQTVMTYDASSPGAIAYMSVAREIANRGGAPINLQNESA